MPKPSAKKVSPQAMISSPPSDRASKIRRPVSRSGAEWLMLTAFWGSPSVPGGKSEAISIRPPRVSVACSTRLLSAKTGGASGISE